MYKSNPVLIDQLKLRAADIAVKTDRVPYEKFIEAGEHFAEQNNLIIATTPGINPNNYQYEFYSDRVIKDSKKLAEIMYDLDPDGLAHYTVLITKIVGTIMTVSVDSRELFRIKALPMIRGVRLSGIIEKIKVPAQFAKDADGKPIQLLCIGATMQLMNIYKILTNPLNVAMWSDLIPLEARIRSEFLNAGATTSTGATIGGGAHDTQMTDIIMKKYAIGFGRVLIGTKALELSGDNVRSTKLQFIVSNNLDDEAVYLMSLLPTDKFTFHWKIDELNNPLFPKIRRLTMHYEEKGYKHLFLDVYNSGEFSAIPYDTHSTGVKIGSIFILLQYKLIDMLSIQILTGIDLISKQHSEQLCANLMREFNIISKKAADTTQIQDYFPLTYIGLHENEDLAQLRNMQALKESRHIPYYPLMHLAHRKK